MGGKDEHALCLETEINGLRSTVLERIQVTFQGDILVVSQQNGAYILGLSRSDPGVGEGRTHARNQRGRRGRKETELTRATYGDTGV